MNKFLSFLGLVVIFLICFSSLSSNAEELGSCSSWHVARQGYTCYDMAGTCGVSLQSFMGVNNLDSNACNFVQIGRKYCCN
ncbi:hypothetical protein RB653_008948 [Dictyostelium firmibasis]|uniref:LysM domain-containing protein n=1 Tax=Dictyostelium firmibasis TaxID=79012 RepID=A0AAN7U035_9MYCE